MKSWGDELARLVDERIHPSVPDLPGLDAILPDDRPSGIVCTVEADQSQWQFILASTSPASLSVRVPADKPATGRWLLTGAGATPPATASNTLASVTATIAATQLAGLGAGVKSARVPVGAALPAGARPIARELILGTTFGGGTATVVTLDFGGTVPNDIIAGQSLFAGAPAAMAGTSGINPTGSHGGQQLQATITSDADLNTLTAGSVSLSLVYAIVS